MLLSSKEVKSIHLKILSIINYISIYYICQLQKKQTSLANGSWTDERMREREREREREVEGHVQMYKDRR